MKILNESGKKFLRYVKLLKYRHPPIPLLRHLFQLLNSMNEFYNTFIKKSKCHANL